MADATTTNGTMPRPPWLASGLSDHQRGELWCREHGKRPYKSVSVSIGHTDWRWLSVLPGPHTLPENLHRALGVRWINPTEADAFAAVGAAVRAAATVAMGEGWDR